MRTKATQMSLFRSIFTARRADPASDAGQTLPQKMNLEERMAFRREMLFEAIALAMKKCGMVEKSYRLRVSRMDKRGHVYAVMIELSGEFMDDPRYSHAALCTIGKTIVATAGASGLLQVHGVYWNVSDLSSGFESSRAEAPAAGLASTLQDNWPEPFEVEQRLYASDIAPLSS